MAGFTRSFDDVDKLIKAVSDHDPETTVRLLEDANQTGGPCNVHDMLKEMHTRNPASRWYFTTAGAIEHVLVISADGSMAVAHDSPVGGIDIDRCKRAAPKPPGY
jgi:hypothetical protein